MPNNGTPLQYFCLENPMEGGAWWAAVRGVARSRTQLSDFTFMHWKRKWQPTPVFLPGESQGQGSLVSYHLWGRTVGHDWSDLAAATTGEGIPRWLSSKRICLTTQEMQRCGFDLYVRKTSCKWQPTPVFLPGELFGQKSLAGHYSPKSQTWLSDWAHNNRTGNIVKEDLDTHYIN